MTPQSSSRLLLLPGLRRTWRDRHTLQLGVDPRRALLVELADPATARLLDLLDGRHTEAELLRAAGRLGISADGAGALLSALRRAGLLRSDTAMLPGRLPAGARDRLLAEAAALALRPSPAGVPAEILARRGRARVLLTGGGRLAAPLAVALAEAGVGHVCPALTGRVAPGDPVAGSLRPGDLRRPRAAAVADAIRRAAPDTRTGPLRPGAPCLAVHLGVDRPPALLAAGHARRGQAYLVTGLREGTVVVGPLVPPRGAPCISCLDLHRRDRDPGWAAPDPAPADGGVEPGSTPTLLAGAGYAAAEALRFLDAPDGETPETLGATVEIAAPGRHRRRSWAPHPDCGCTG